MEQRFSFRLSRISFLAKRSHPIWPQCKSRSGPRIGICFCIPFVAHNGQLLRAGSQGPHSRLKSAVGSDAKGIASVVLYAAAIAVAFVNPWVAEAVYLGVAVMWLVPDPRIERRVRHE